MKRLIAVVVVVVVVVSDAGMLCTVMEGGRGNTSRERNCPTDGNGVGEIKKKRILRAVYERNDHTRIKKGRKGRDREKDSMFERKTLV